VLQNSLLHQGHFTPQELAARVADEINNIPDLRVEYYAIVDGYSLQPLTSWDESEWRVGCLAVYCGEVRLIDNIRYR